MHQHHEEHQQREEHQQGEEPAGGATGPRWVALAPRPLADLAPGTRFCHADWQDPDDPRNHWIACGPDTTSPDHITDRGWTRIAHPVPGWGPAATINASDLLVVPLQPSAVHDLAALDQLTHLDADQINTALAGLHLHTPATTAVDNPDTPAIAAQDLATAHHVNHLPHVHDTQWPDPHTPLVGRYHLHEHGPIELCTNLTNPHTDHGSTDAPVAQQLVTLQLVTPPEWDTQPTLGVKAWKQRGVGR